MNKIDEFLRKEGVLLPKDYFLEVYSSVLKFAGGLAGLLQAGSKKAGVSAAKAFEPYISKDDVEANLKEVMEEFFKKAGFGDLDVKVESDRVVVDVKDSFLLKAHEKPQVALRPLVGALEGFLEEILRCKVKSNIEGTKITVELKR